MIANSTWQYTSGDVVLAIPAITSRDQVENTIDGYTSYPTVYIPVSKVDCVVLHTDLRIAYAELVVRDMRFYVLDSPEVRQALANTIFDNVFK